MFKKSGSTTSMQPASTTIIVFPTIFWSHGVLHFSFVIDLPLVVLDFLWIQSLLMIPSWKFGNIEW